MHATSLKRNGESNKKPCYFLEPWQEALGRFLSSIIDGNGFYVRLSFGDIYFPLDSLEATVLQGILPDIKIGERIGILRTDMPEKPVCVRILKNGSLN
jgi:hypothetical protein